MVPELADAVASRLRDLGYGEVVRCYRPVFGPPELETRKLSVFPKAAAISTASRGAMRWRAEVGIALQSRLSTDSDLDLDELITAAEQIAPQFPGWRPASLPGTVCLSAQVENLYSAEHYEAAAVGTVVLSVAFEFFVDLEGPA